MSPLAALASSMPLGLGPDVWVLLGAAGCLGILGYIGYMFSKLMNDA
ncbi:hypothetical protein [Halospeciosus flavus]|uniref:Uncharacterized protein n=1 Tax=Halospeciosus flavus TaxID=3032283 RepID=A0ABD5Z8Z6_9EURY|nr:hypothetical protein [Halospeciosus flavus]